MNEAEPLELKCSRSFIMGESIMPCPQCQFEYVHIVKLKVHRERDEVTIEKDTIQVVDKPNTTRGVIITMEYVCESMHRGEIILHFYKGNIYVSHIKLHDLEVGETYADIFRD